MALYQVENQWGGSSAPWNEGGKWGIGSRDNQNVVAINAKSDDGGETLNGTITYSGEGPIGFRAKRSGSNDYTVENQWGGDAAPWHDGGTWTIGGRSGQNVVAIDVKSDDGGETLNGTITYKGEGSIGFKGVRASGVAKIKTRGFEDVGEDLTTTTDDDTNGVIDPKDLPTFP